jgi:AAA15 family ATPase/GTPase
MDYPYYEIKDKKSTIKVKSNKSYLLYIVPQHNNDTFKSWKLRKKKKLKSKVKYVDGNTLFINLKGKIGQKFTLTLSNNRKITILISNKDNAKVDKKR